MSKLLADFAGRIGQFWPYVGAAGVIFLLFSLMLSLNWHGFRGGGGDDWQYLDAARCLRKNLFCIPDTHWAARYAVVIPLAFATAIFGESHLTVGLPSLLSTFVVIICLFLLMLKYSGAKAALLSCLALVLTPVFVDRAVRPNADMIELAWMMLSVTLLCLAGPGRRGLLVASGLCAGVALGARATALVPIGLLIVGWLWLDPSVRRQWGSILVWAVAATIAPLVEMLVHGALHGGPMLRWALELNHTSVPSSALDAKFRGEFPLFNPELIGAWPVRHGPNVHWSVNGLINLFWSPEIGLTLAAAFITLIVGRHRLGSNLPRWVAVLPIGALMHFTALTYGLGVDPTPRMFLPGLVLLSICFGFCLANLHAKGRNLLPAALVPLLLVRGTTVQYAAFDLMALDRSATAIIIGASEPPSVELNTSRMLAINSAAKNLPVADRNSGSLLILTDETCETEARKSRFDSADWRTLADMPIRKDDPALIAWLRAKRILISPQPEISLCLIQRG